MTKSKQESWEIRWYNCTADARDVEHAKSKGEEISVGDVLWRVPESIGPLSVDHNHWAGWYVDVPEEYAFVMVAARDMLLSIEAALSSNMVAGEESVTISRKSWEMMKAAHKKAQGE